MTIPCIPCLILSVTFSYRQNKSRQEFTPFFLPNKLEFDRYHEEKLTHSEMYYRAFMLHLHLLISVWLKVYNKENWESMNISVSLTFPNLLHIFFINATIFIITVLYPHPTQYKTQITNHFYWLFILCIPSLIVSVTFIQLWAK